METEPEEHGVQWSPFCYFYGLATLKDLLPFLALKVMNVFRSVHQPVAGLLGVALGWPTEWGQKQVSVLGCRFRFPLAHFKKWLLQENNCSSADKWPRAMDRPCPRRCPRCHSQLTSNPNSQRPQAGANSSPSPPCRLGFCPRSRSCRTVASRSERWRGNTGMKTQWFVWLRRNYFKLFLERDDHV